MYLNNRHQSGGLAVTIFPPIHSQRQSKYVPWRAWIVSLILFATIVSLTRHPPSSDAPKNGTSRIVKGRASDSTGSNERTPASAYKVKPSSLQDDKIIIFVECAITTPHAASREETIQREAVGGAAAAAAVDLFSPAPLAQGNIRIAVRRDLAPNVSNAFLALVASKHFDGNYIFRVPLGFIAQWGIEGQEKKKLRGGSGRFPKVDLDPKLEGRSLSNVRGTLNFAGGNAASGQVYVNKGNNSRLDKERGSLPFATLDAKSMHVVDRIYSGYKEGMGQVKAVNKGDAEVMEKFPMMSRVETCVVVD